MKVRTIVVALIGTVILGNAPAIWNEEAHADSTVNTVWDADDDPELAKDITITVQDVANHFPEISGITIGSGPLPVNVYGHTGPGMMIFSETYMSDPAALDRDVRSDVAQGYHPSLGICSPAEFMALHESAHAIDIAHYLHADYAVAAHYGSGVELHGVLSGYSFDALGGLNVSEAIAEAFASTVCNGGNDLEKQFTKLLVEG